MTPYHDADGVTIYHGDCLDVMGALDADSVDSICTDPPYGIQFMGRNWDHGVPGIPFWQAALRLAKPGAMLLAFGGTRTHHRLWCAIEDAGWEIRDTIMWVFGSGFPKSLDISKGIDKAAGAERATIRAHPQPRGTDGNTYGHYEPTATITAPATEAAKLWEGWGTALKPSHEPICVAMKPLDGTFAANAQKWGVAGFNIDGGRVGSTVETWPASRSYHAQRGPKPRGAHGSGDGVTMSTGASPPGRFPSNLIHDGSDEVMAEFPATATEGHTPTLRGRGGIACDGHKGQQTAGERWHDTGTAARFFYCAKASKAERGNGNSHPCVKPLALVRYLLTLTSTPTGGVVLDPFMGSGSTLVAAAQVGRRCVGIELDERYCEIAVRRLAGVQKEFAL